MELYNEENRTIHKKSKLPMVIGISIIMLVIIMIIIICAIMYLRTTVLEIKLDGADAIKLEEILYIDENTSEVYIPIRKIAKYFAYEDYRGDYKYKSEDSSKCYVKNEFETAMFTQDSDVLIKTRGNSDYEYVQLDQKVFEKDGELYTTIDGIKKAYNVEFSYDSEKNKIHIFTMDYLINYYAKRLKLEDYKATFTDKKAIFESMLIVEVNNQYGVVNAQTGDSILECKYDSVTYLPNTTDFLVKSNNKYGIVSKEAQTKVKIAYDEIKIMDNQNGLYLIKQKNLFGVVDTKENTIIQPEYQQIGLDISAFTQNGIENQYILLDELIPIKNNNLWAFFDIKGEQITDFVYTNLGCTTSSDKSSYPVLLIPSYDVIIVGKNNFYNLMVTDGREIINGYVLDSVYMKSNIETGENKFYMTYNGQTRDVEEFLASI